MTEIYPGLREYVRKGILANKDFELMFRPAVEHYGYPNHKRRFKNFCSTEKQRMLKGRAPKKKKKEKAMAKPQKPVTPKNHEGLDGFRALYDDSIIIPKTIEEGIEKHLRTENGEPTWRLDKEFRVLCDVPVHRWRRYADEYRHLQVQIPGGDVAWGHPEIVDKMRKAVQR